MIVFGRGRRESEINVIYIDDRQELMCVLFRAGAKKNIKHHLFTEHH